MKHRLFDQIFDCFRKRLLVLRLGALDVVYSQNLHTLRLPKLKKKRCIPIYIYILYIYIIVCNVWCLVVLFYVAACLCLSNF